MTFFNILQKTWHNFLERQLFDLIHGTTTYEVVDKADFLPIVDLKHGKAYYASWTNEVKNSHQVLIHLLKNHFTDYVFIDLGCGKGKACLVWEIQNRRLAQNQFIYGLDYYEPFIKIAQKNYVQVFKQSGNFYHVDAQHFDYQQFNKPLIIYLFNPFDAYLLDAVLSKIGSTPCICIYNIPMHQEVFDKHEFQRIYSKDGPNQNQKTIIYSNHAL
jgi:SAM-dependent methyltransferase